MLTVGFSALATVPLVPPFTHVTTVGVALVVGEPSPSRSIPKACFARKPDAYG